MKKIISLFKRNYDGDHNIYDELVPGAEWVAAGEGLGTVKIDGTSCLVRDGRLFKRYDAKAFTIGPDGQKQPWNRTPPAGFEPAQDPDPVTGHWPGWVPVGDEPDSRWYREAAAKYDLSLLDGTYELIGPKIGGIRTAFRSTSLSSTALGNSKNNPRVISTDCASGSSRTLSRGLCGTALTAIW